MMQTEKRSPRIDVPGLHLTPKVELHIHLEGSLDRGTLDRISARKGLRPLEANPYVFEDFEGFNRVFGFLARFLEDEADFYNAALALAGMEKPGDVPAFAPVFEKARSLGLHTVAHAGELAGPDQVAQTLDLLKAERIGHGIHAAQDPALLERLVRDRVPLEVCPTSNVLLKAVPALKDHPVRRLFDAGVPLVINTDDPAFFHTTLSREIQLLSEHFGFTPDEIRTLVQNGFGFSFERGSRT